MRATKAIIHLDNLEYNILQIKNLIDKNTKLCFPVKADGYGHGALEVAKFALKHGVYCLAVATVDEGIELRKGGITCPILLLSLPCPDELIMLVTYDITPFVFEEYFVCELQKTASRLRKNVSVYLKVDSGMGRIGCKIEDAQKLALVIKDLPNLNLAGMATHLCVSDCVSQEDFDFTNKQIENFTWAVNSVKAAKIDPGIVTCSASGGVLLYAKKAQFDMVRPGILFYGYYPDRCVADYLIEEKGFAPEFKPLMELKTRIESVKKVEKGTSISYGRTWFAGEDTYIATLPIGYADGLLRHFAGKLSVQINGKMFPIVGRICMDQCMVDLGSDCGESSGEKVKVWDEVTIFGCDDSDGNTAETLANIAGTISYEITCSINKRVPRVYVG
ncbi:MAG: alanine racemase [Treponemataceae bacterium]|nr:alanine racemase [Treponemataceae bacterium]